MSKSQPQYVPVKIEVDGVKTTVGVAKVVKEDGVWVTTVRMFPACPAHPVKEPEIRASIPIPKTDEGERRR